MSGKDRPCIRNRNPANGADKYFGDDISYEQTSAGPRRSGREPIDQKRAFRLIQ